MIDVAAPRVSSECLHSTMHAAVVSAPGLIHMTECPRPEPGPGQALIQVEACGVCASNLPRFEGRPWFQYPGSPGEMGHEGVGRITALGAGPINFCEGDRVSFLSNHAYAQYAVADAASMVAVPPELDMDCLPGEPLGCAWNVFQRSGISAGDQVAVVGAGFLAVMVAQLAVSARARVIVIARRPLGAMRMGLLETADIVVAEDPATISGEVFRLTHGTLCHVVIEATGHEAPLNVAATLARERGRLVIAGYHQDGRRQVDMQLWNWRGLDVINAHERNPAVYVEGMRAAYAAVIKGWFDPRPLLTHHRRLDQLQECLELARQRPAGFVKAIVYP